jgi:L-alanine-DL-glutamate epimerase-like enolase superfamily enzyme
MDSAYAGKVTLKASVVEAWAMRAPIAVPVRSSFGEMRNRPAVFVRIRDVDGNSGWGEAWCNFPPVGAEHRARLINELAGPALVALGDVPVEGLFDRLMARFHIMILQSGEWGPFRQVCAALDMAAHDLAARRAKLPLWRFLGGVNGRVTAYASGIACEDIETVVPRELRAGHRAFKLKIGFAEQADIDGLERLRVTAGIDAHLMADANQAWSFDVAMERCARLAPFGLDWIEEPLAADRPWNEWQSLAKSMPVEIAAGENLNAKQDFDAAVASGAVAFIQPDAAKWGGVSGCFEVARQTLQAGRTYCPHFLGGGIGLLASAHILAAAGGDGLLEIDTNPNPWRERIAGARLTIRDGGIDLGASPGIGVDPAELDLSLA